MLARSKDRAHSQEPPHLPPRCRDGPDRSQIGPATRLCAFSVWNHAAASNENEIVGHQRGFVDVLERQNVGAIEGDHRVSANLADVRLKGGEVRQPEPAQLYHIKIRACKACDRILPRTRFEDEFVACVSGGCDHLVISAATIESIAVARSGEVVIAAFTKKVICKATGPNPVIAITAEEAIATAVGQKGV